jgi:hypothetical protein
MTYKTFGPKAEDQTRALQAWQILIGKAAGRQTVTYADLSVLMFGHEAAGVLARILGHIAFFCQDHDLPPLTVLVVGKPTGEPGSEIPLERDKIDEERERVYRCNWYDVYPPSEFQLADSHKKHRP